MNPAHRKDQTLCRKLVAAIRKEDDSRLVTFACSHVWNDICTALTDIVAYNTYPGWISADAAEEPPSYIRENRDKIIERFRTYNPPDWSWSAKWAAAGSTAAMTAPRHNGPRNSRRSIWRRSSGRSLHRRTSCGLAIWQFNDAKSYLRKGSNIRCKPLAQNLAGVFTSTAVELAAETVKKLFAEKK
ncbi:MAG: hypothetical protein V8T87_17305 [Victivallales bacterium]